VPEIQLESKSVGKPLKPKVDEIPSYLKPENIRLEPAIRGAESIQAVSAAKIPQSVLKEST
jgi:hypothetical protein